VRAAKSDIDYERKPPIKTTEGINGLVVRERRPITVADVRADPRFPFREAAAREGLVSMLAVPLIVRERVIGVMNAFTTEPRTFTDAEIGLFSTLANQTALAIENAQLVTNAAVVREMHHRVRNNLQQVAMLLRLQAGQGGDPGGHLATAVNRIQSIAAVHDALAHEGYRMVNVKDVAERLVRLGAQSLVAPGLKLEVAVDGEGLSLPSRAATSLALVVNELLANALEHAFAGRTTGRIHIHFSHQGERVIIDVVDDGIGLPVGFDPAASLGLQIVHALVQDDLRGTLEFLPNEPTGTRATIRLPRPDLHPSD
jgi:two-component sensor histidine kinase